MQALRLGYWILLIGTLTALGSCGGGSSTTQAPLTPALSLPTGRISASSPVQTGCNGGSSSSLLYANAEVEPFVAVQPGNSNLLAAAWQQDRWSDGGARALVTAVSADGGVTWSRRLMPFSRCGGALTGSSGDYERASDPWVDIGPGGVIYSMALSFNGGTLLAGSSSALLVSRSTDSGRSWSEPATLLRDGDTLFNDKNSLTADPTDARYVFAVWDRIENSGFGPTLMARSSDSGVTWEPARVIYAPVKAGGISQTLGNRIVVLPDGTLINLFTQIDTLGNQQTSWFGVLRSRDKGLTWSAPIRITDIQAVGAKDPQSGKAIRDGAYLGAIAVGPAGSLWLTWQDARFSSGQRDAILLTRSSDGGLSWSAPLLINRQTSVAAFTPSIAISADGLVGVTHYDLRPDNADPATLLAGAWLLSSRDGLNWVETPVWSPFDMAQAPDARGLFLGDYQGLVPSGSGFLPVLALSGTDLDNRTDIYALRVTPTAMAASTASIRARALSAAQLPTDTTAAEFKRARQEAIVTTMERRMPGWAARMSKASE
jgi:hypothetical protein